MSKRPEQLKTGRVYDVIVVGSGAGGITAALALAKRGRSVLLLEAAKQFGGMLNPFSRHGFEFDVGLHYIGDAGQGQALTLLLDYLGMGDVKFRELTPELIDRYVFPTYEGSLCKGIDRWIERLRTQFPDEARGLQSFARLLHATESIMKIGLAIYGDESFRARDAARILRASPELLRTLNETLEQTLRRHFRDQHLMNIIAGPCGDIGLPPSRLSSPMHIGLLVDFLGGAYYPVGGTRPLRDAFVRELERNGADLVRNQPVKHIEVRGESDFAVRTSDGHEFLARSVVSNVDAHDLIPMLGGAHVKARIEKRAKNFVPGLGTLCVFLGLDEDPRKHGISDANIWHYPEGDIDAPYRETQRTHFEKPPTFFLTSPSCKDPTSAKAPAGHHTLELITASELVPFERFQHLPTMKRGEEYMRIKDDLADAVIREAEQRYFPDLSKHVVVREVATPATTVSFVNARGGSIYGPEHTPAQSLWRRIPPSIGIPGLFVAGSSVFSAGVVSCALSGFLAAELAHRHLAARAPRKQPAFPAKPQVNAASRPASA